MLRGKLVLLVFSAAPVEPRKRIACIGPLCKSSQCVYLSPCHLPKLMVNFYSTDDLFQTLEIFWKGYISFLWWCVLLAHSREHAGSIILTTVCSAPNPQLITLITKEALTQLWCWTWRCLIVYNHVCRSIIRVWKYTVKFSGCGPLRN